MGNRCSIQQSEEINCWLEQSPENRLYRPFRYFWATLYSVTSPDYTQWTGGGSHCHEQWLPPPPPIIVYNPACYTSDSAASIADISYWPKMEMLRFAAKLNKHALARSRGTQTELKTTNSWVLAQREDTMTLWSDGACIINGGGGGGAAMCLIPSPHLLNRWSSVASRLRPLLTTQSASVIIRHWPVLTALTLNAIKLSLKPKLCCAVNYYYRLTTKWLYPNIVWFIR